jgi:site-specific recombinase XerC
LLHEVTPAQIRTVLKQAKDEGKQRRPVVFLQRLRSMYDAAIEDEIVEKNPARRIKNPKRRERAQIIPSFTEVEQAKLLQVAQGQDRNFIAVMLGTAIGPGELCAIRPEDIDLQAGKIAVAGSLGRFGEGATKTPGRTRIVEIHDLVAPVTAALREQLKFQRQHRPLFAKRAAR